MRIGSVQRHGTESKRTGVQERVEIDGAFPFSLTLARLDRASFTDFTRGVPPGGGSAERRDDGLRAFNRGEDGRNHAGDAQDERRQA